jgi:hypothetical protein
MHTAVATGAVGGGIAAEGPGGLKVIRLTDSVVANNSAETTDDLGGTSGGGIYDADGDLQLRRTTVSGNSLSGPTAGGIQYGGGIFLGPNKGSLLLLNSTVSGNTAPKAAVPAGVGAGVDLSDGAGGMMFPQATATVINSTIAGNVAAGDGDAIREDGTQGAAFNVRGSILAAADAAGTCAQTNGTIASQGRNVTTDPACFAAPGAGDAQGTDPLLGGLADNGGPSVGAPGQLEPLLTQALSTGTPAVDRVPAAECTNEVLAPLGADERGYPRPFPAGGACDAGAYELFICKGQPLNVQGQFDGCSQDTQASLAPPAPASTGSQATAKKKCKKKKKKRVAAAKKKKCKKKK